MKKQSLGLKLLELRQLHNLTQKQLCEALNIGRSAYSYFETGSRIPDLETLLLFARYYKVSLDELVSSDWAQETVPAEDSEYSNTQIVYHLKSKHIPVEFILELSKADFDFLKDYKQLTDDNKAELLYLMNYKLRKQ
ncbi:MAG: helix-turn-helix transcriptional regulator [Eubacterium sp.]|nr:helix-turn-helix transcriptional regulator [Eubacterium sp.]MCI8919421.1 helix-turn-helix transcriptional regulator [Eubacterium sp.]